MERRAKLIAVAVVLFVLFSAVAARVTPPEPRAAATAYLFAAVLAASLAYILVIKHGFLVVEAE